MKKIYGLALLGLLASVSTATFAMDEEASVVSEEGTASGNNQTGAKGWKDGDELDNLNNLLAKSSLLDGGTGNLDEEDGTGTQKITHPDTYVYVGDAYDYLSNLIDLNGDEETALAAALQKCIQTLFDQSENGGLQEGTWSDLAANLVAKKESSEQMQAYLEEVSKTHKGTGTLPKSEEDEDEENDV